MWPMKLDMTKEECRGVLRRLELESYGTVISTFRAQGFLCKEKQRILEDLRRILHISNDRHRAEARRVANDERLYTVAEIICGPNSSQDWCREGHRTFPILPRSVPHTALTYIANTVYEQLTRANCKMPHPADTSCNRQKKAEDMFKFDLVRKELSLFEKGFERDAKVVTTDPLQNIMSKSYIEIDLKRPQDATAQEESKKDDKPAAESEKPANEQEVAAPTGSPNGTSTAGETTAPAAVNEQPSLSDILLDNSSHPASSNKMMEKLNKSFERSRKKSLGAKRQSKVKSPYPASKPSKNGPTTLKQSSKAVSIPSPHLMHSYAVPFDLASATNGGSASPDPPQPPYSAMSYMPYPAPLPPPAYIDDCTPSSPIHASSKHPQCILPSSKKDIQYNLSKLNPTNNLPARGNVTIPLRGSGGNVPAGSPRQHPILSYQKKSNSKNILIPTCTAAATLASLGLHLTEQTSEWISSKNRESCAKPVKANVPQETPNPRVVFSPVSTVSSAPEKVSEHPATTTNTTRVASGKDPIHPANSADTSASISSPVRSVESSTTAKTVVNNALTVKQPTIAGFTPVKSGSKLSISKMQLMPLNASGTVPQPVPVATGGIMKNNILILPKANASGTLNLGQKINIFSPPKVIVQSVPNVNNAASLDFEPDRKPTDPSRQLFTSGKLLSEISPGTTPMEVAAGTAKEAENKQQPLRSVVKEAPIPAPAQTRLQNNVPVKSAPLGKITISASQLVPFKGTLHGATLPTAVNSATPNAVTVPSQAKLGPNTAEGIADPPKTSSQNKPSTDWEKEVDRANGSQHPSGDATLAAVPPSKTKTETKVETTQNSHNASSASTRAESSCSSAGNVEARQGEYDAATAADRADDSSATDSADAEEDPDDEPNRVVHEGIEEEIYNEERIVDFESDPDGIIIEEDEEHYVHLIEEITEDDNYIEEIVDEQMDVGYDSSREMIGEMETTVVEHLIEEHASMNGIEDEQVQMHYMQSSDMIAEELIENGESHEQREHPHGKDDIVCELLELDEDGKYSARQFSYEQAIAEGLPTMAKPSHKAKRPVS